MEGGREGRGGKKTRAVTRKGEHEWVALTSGPSEWGLRSGVDSRFFSPLEKTSPPFLGCPSGSPSPNSMLRVLLSAQASAARLSGLLLLPPVQPCCLGPSKWGDRPPGGGLHAGPVQGLQRLLEQARSPGELLRWLGQNPTKVRAHHYPVALRRLGQLLGSQPRPPPVEQATLQDLSQLIIRNCPSFDIHTIHVCLHLAVLLGEEGVWGVGVNGRIEKEHRRPKITDRIHLSGFARNGTWPGTLGAAPLYPQQTPGVQQHSFQHS